MISFQSITKKYINKICSFKWNSLDLVNFIIYFYTNMYTILNIPAHDGKKYRWKIISEDCKQVNMF